MLFWDSVLWEELKLLCLKLLVSGSSLRINFPEAIPTNLAPLYMGNLFVPAKVISIYPFPRQESKNLSRSVFIIRISRLSGS